MANIQIVVLLSKDVGLQPWWSSLHSTINMSYQNKKIMAYPPTWTRLNPDPAIGAKALSEELGPNGYLAVVLLGQEPIACGGVEPFRGLNWINDVLSVGQFANSNNNTANEHTTATSTDEATLTSDHTPKNPTEEWEICCFCVHPNHRHQRLGSRLLETLIKHIRSLGGKRLMSNYVIEETGVYWPKMGFETIRGAGGILKKGYTNTAGAEGLRSDIHFAVGVRNV